MRRAFLGIDCGTGSTKAVLVDAESGALFAVGRAPHAIVERADGTSRQDPQWWLDAARYAIREARSAAGDGVEVAGIGVSGQQHGLVALNEMDRPVATARLWNDMTSAGECQTLLTRLGGLARVLDLTGNTFVPGYTAPALLAMRLREPEAYAAARRFCLPHDWLNLWLSGEFATEPGDASGTAWFDVRHRTYSQEVLRAIDPDRDWPASLPHVGDSLSVVGKLRAEVAADLGLPTGLPISAGGGDNMCSAIGAGAIVEGHVVVSLGSSGTAFARRGEPATDPLGEVSAFCSSDGGWLPLACTLNATGATDWVSTLFGLDRAGFEQALLDGQPGARGLSFLPYLAGERTPSLPRAAGAFNWLRREHERDDFVRAVVEGVTFGLAYGLTALGRAGVSVTRITLVGGGATSPAWGQLCADVFGVPVGRPSVTETAALGAALQARWVIDGTRPADRLGFDVEWQPQPDERLDAARARHETMRNASIAAEAAPASRGSAT